MPTVRVVLVEPKNEGNVGAVARAMRNFGSEALTLVGPCALGPEARKRAMHATDLLDAARTVDAFETAVEDADLVVGTTGVDTVNEKRFARIAMPPREFAARVAPMAGVVALVFGREDFGLFDAEIAQCDLLVTVPASKAYPILNLSHAAAILLYELHAAGAAKPGTRPASSLEKETLHAALAGLLEATHYPAHKVARTKVMFRRLVGRAVPSKWEFHALMGVLQRATNRIRRLEKGPR